MKNYIDVAIDGGPKKRIRVSSEFWKHVLDLSPEMTDKFNEFVSEVLVTGYEIGIEICRSAVSEQKESASTP